MTMLTPIIYSPYSFDANMDYLLTFDYEGNQARKNKLIIRKNDDNQVVYSEIQVTMKLAHKIPAHTLANGICYNVSVIVYDKDDNESPESEPVIFYCFTTPTLTFSNLSNQDVVNNSSFQVQMVYSQLENEPLNWYQVVLFNSLGEEIHNSGYQYPQGKTEFTYNLTALEDNSLYYLQVTGETLNHMPVMSAKISFSAEYINPLIFAKLDLTNNSYEGLIKIQSNLISILGKSNPDPPIYIDNKEVDLTQDGHYVYFDEGFSMRKDFTMQILMRKPVDYSVVLFFEESPITLELKYMKGKFASVGHEVGYFQLRVYNGFTNYVLISNYIELPSDTDKLHIWLRAKNDIYQLVVTKMNEVKA